MELKISNIEQHRANFAFKRANEHSNSGNYDANVKKFPMYIKTNGFTNALAFAYQNAFNKRNPDMAWQNLYNDLCNWLIQEPQGIIKIKLKNALDKNSQTGFMDTIINLETDELRLVTSEVMAFLNWLRRFVKENKDGK